MNVPIHSAGMGGGGRFANIRCRDKLSVVTRRTERAEQSKAKLIACAGLNAQFSNKLYNARYYFACLVDGDSKLFRGSLIVFFLQGTLNVFDTKVLTKRKL